MSAIKEIRCLVSGRVTGVMYRDFVCRKARRLKLVGTVQNVERGLVRVVARGDETSLNQFIVYLNRGSLPSKVDQVEVNWRAPRPEPTFADFKIIY